MPTPRDTFDPQVIVDNVGKDPAKLFEWVRDNTYLVPYRGALRGYKDTRVPMVINVFSFWVLAFPISYLAAVTYRAAPAYIWLGFVIGLTVAACLLTFRYTKVSRVSGSPMDTKLPVE